MTIHVNIGEAKTRLSELIAASERGEEVVIARAGKAAVKLVRADGHDEADAVQARRAAFGMFRHAFDPAMVDILLEPMSEEELALWYDAPIFPESEKSE